MLAKRDDMICCCAVGGMPRTGMAEGRPTITQGALARAATGGSLHRSPWIEHRTLPDWRTGRACLRGPSCVEGAIRGGANGGGCAARTERTMPYQGRNAKTIAWADSESVQARLTGRQVTRDNCIYREQSGQPLPDAGRQAHLLPHTNARRKVLYTVERKEVFTNPLTPPAFDGVQGDARGQPIIARDNYFGIAC